MDKRIYDNYVLRTAELGSFTKAAAALNVSQPALSSGISALEKELGFRIFDRSSAPVSLTPEGKVYHDYLRRVQVLTADYRTRVEELQARARKTAVIGSPAAYADTLVADAVTRLMERDPECRVTVRTAPLPQLIGQAAEGQLHCFISTSENLPAGFGKRFIRREKVYLCVPADDALNTAFESFRTEPGKENALPDFRLLNGRPFIFLEKDMPLQKQTERFLEETGVKVISRLTVNQVSTAVSFARRGLGLCFATEEALEGRMDAERLCIYSLPPAVTGRCIYAAYNEELFLPDVCRQLMDLLNTEEKEGNGHE